MVVFIITGCEVAFTPSITPIVWFTVAPQQFDQMPAKQVPQPSPIPLASTPTPGPVPFLGVDDLNCAFPQGGDEHYGYCRIPESMQYYVWGECQTSCPDGPYPGIELLVLSETETLRAFISVIDSRDDKTDKRKESFAIGGFFGSLGVAGGVPGVLGACLKSGSLTGGWGCLVVILAVGADAFVTYWSFDQGAQANKDLTKPWGLEESAQDLFDLLRSSNETLPPNE